jgi:exopolysaccharide biosynthesis polyprenyl glycosylphosphotransferase
LNDDRQVALRRLTLLLDALVLPVSLLLAFALHEALRPVIPMLKDPPDPQDYAVLFYFVLPLWLFLDGVLGLHRLFERRWSRYEVLIELIKLHALGFLGLTVVLFLSRGIINRAIVVAFLVVNIVLMFVVRVIITAWVQSSWQRGETRNAWLMVGDAAEAMRTFVADATLQPWPPQVIGFLSITEPQGVELPPRLGAPDALPTVLHDKHVDLVVFFPPLHHPDAAGPLLQQCERLGVTAAFALDTVHKYSIAPRVMTQGTTPLITFDWVPQRPTALALKHAADVVVATLLLLLLSPLLLVVALLVRITMGAGVLYAQERVGQHGRRFRMLKFRTMVHGAEEKKDELKAQNEMSGPVFKMADDPRVTGLGRVLRRWSIDELPQLLNVVRGSMSLIGPRPLPVAEQQEIEGWYRRRLSMKPGITGLWQVSGRSGVDFDDWMKLDLLYVDTWSLRLDLFILLKTLPAVLSRRGAH